ncbi:STAS/SEC14 domain-containing protein [Rufibacter sp. LB8]|uniref:STAS/SEC14 domain-containing protein n=1 Tax=Rufibacter sp. LB8 TaxID=2777781 RepID=UPI00178C44FF|nr:STAS/SEC14 domain-containing protein [Rufibacter sp. LB8]
MTNWQNVGAHSNSTISYDPEKDWIYVKWSGHIDSEDVITTAGKYLEFLKGHKTPRLLNDKSEVTGDWEDANDWLEYEWLPQALEGGLRFLSMVISRDLHDLAPSQDLQRRLAPACEMQLFRDLPSARQWLASV